MSTTFEEAKVCPKCEMPGEDVSTSKVRSSQSGKMVEIHMIYCRQKGCVWYNTSWIVQVNEDNTIPEPYGQLGRKKYPKLSAESETKVREAMETQLRMEQEPGGVELRNPRGY